MTDAQALSMVISVASLLLTAGVAYLGAVRGTTGRLAQLETKLDILSSRVELHNGLMEKMAAMRAEMDEVKRRLEVIERKDG